VPAAVTEVRRACESPEAYVHRLAVEKARSGWALATGSGKGPTLGADTVVVLDDEVLGKPEDAEAAFGMLTRLSGRRHTVMTAVALVDTDRETSCVQKSRVKFRRLSQAECRRYSNLEEPLDKAGAYAIQGHAAVFIEHLEGSYSGVMGLPLFETWKLIVEFGIDV
jgi:septum formation protein